MNLYLPDYSFGNGMFIVARDDRVYEELIQRNVDIMHIGDSQIVFMPGNHKYDVKKIQADRLALLNDYDIVEMSKSGLLYRAFANNEADTTVLYIKKSLEDLDVVISRVANGIPIGADMDYIDSLTLESAFKNRKEVLD